MTMIRRRGDKLHEHILWIAKDTFLEMGFERASMDLVASRAETSKRSLYAHFESKENLFLAVIDLVRGLFLSRLRMPADYSAQPEEALVLFCGKYLETLLYGPSIQMCRMSIAETSRFPLGAAQHFDVMFTEVHTRLAAYLNHTFGLSGQDGEHAVRKLLGQVLYPRLMRALFGMDTLAVSFDHDDMAPDFDLAPIRAAVVDLLASIQQK